MRKDSRVLNSPHSLNDRWSFQVSNRETDVFNLASKVAENTLKVLYIFHQRLFPRTTKRQILTKKELHG